MGAWLPLLRYHDERMLHRLVVSRRRGWDWTMRRVTHLGDATAVIPVTLVLLLEVVPGAGRAGWIAAFGLAASHALVQLLKRTVSRSRPRLPIGACSLIDAPDHFSFPSGHAAASLSVALGLAVALPPLAALLLVALSALVGVSRCYLGVHYPSDVLAGWVLAGAGFLAAQPALVWLGILSP